MGKIKVLDQDVTISSIKDEDYILLTDIARYKDSQRTDYIIQNWLRTGGPEQFCSDGQAMDRKDRSHRRAHEAAGR